MKFARSSAQDVTIKLCLSFFLLFLFLIPYSLFLIHSSSAQVPPPYVPCESVSPNEFHSLRPYQASPCNEGVSDVALFCGNDLLLKDTITRSKSQATRCEDLSDTTQRCYFSTGNTTEIAINLKNATFPIAGYTEEDVAIEDKVNEYVSWYLNGAVNLPENGTVNTDNPEEAKNLINFSGPLKKLLSWKSLLNERLNTIKEAADVRHNQLIGTTRLKSLQGNILSPLFKMIPLSSTEDRKGAVETETTPGVSGPGVTITDISFSNQEPADLFVPHMEEISKLAGLLQETFVPKGGETSDAPTQVAPAKACDLAQIRTNPGDKLFAGEIRGDLSYTADFSCDFRKPELGPRCTLTFGCGNDDKYNCIKGRCVEKGIDPNPSCSKDIFVNMSVITKTPLADAVWEKLVAGPAGVFKRIFPKIGTEGPIAALLDIPSATKVDYSGNGLVSAGNPGNERKGESAELYFPHMGSVSEYFLKGIQTILRPKGYGEQILSGQPGTLPTPPPAGKIDCNQNAPDVSIPNLISKDAFAALADRWAGASNFANECFNDVVQKAKAAGVNPAYALLTWLIESGASNYGLSVEDFGIHLSYVRGFNAQMAGFLGTVTGSVHIYGATHGIPPWPNELFGHIAYYVTGEFDQTKPDYVRLKDRVKSYYDNFTSYFTSTIAPGCQAPTGPQDNSCP